jgi:hypothetical protein
VSLRDLSLRETDDGVVISAHLTGPRDADLAGELASIVDWPEVHTVEID